MHRRLLLCLLVWVPFVLWAQNDFQIPIRTGAGELQAIESSMSAGRYPALSITLPGLENKEVEKVLRDYLKDLDGRAPKYNRRKREFFVEGAFMPGISEQPVNVYARISPRGSNSAEVIFWFDTGETFLDTRKSSKRLAAAEEWVTIFDREVRLAGADVVIEKEERFLRDLEKEREQLARKEERLKSNIARWEEEIAEARTLLDQIAVEKGVVDSTLQVQQLLLDEARTIRGKID